MIRRAAIYGHLGRRISIKLNSSVKMLKFTQYLMSKRKRLFTCTANKKNYTFFTAHKNLVGVIRILHTNIHATKNKKDIDVVLMK